MHKGMSLQEMAAELQRQTASRKDFIAEQGALRAVVDESETVKVGGLNGEPLALTPHAHRQVGDHLGIPARYYERMRLEQPRLLAGNINTWLGAQADDRRMIRTLDGKARAYLSARYRPLDNLELAEAILPTLLENGAEVMSASLTETRMYVKAILPRLSDDLPEGQRWGSGHVGTFGRDGKVVAAIVVSNSEVGAGSLRVEPSVFTTFCTNLAILTEASMRRYHVGRAFESGEDYAVYRDETRVADDRAFFMKVRDVMTAAFTDEAWAAAIAQIRGAVADRIVSDNLPKVVEVTAKRLALPESTGVSILTELARGGDLSRWGLSSALTSVAGKVDDYETATELERAGGKVLALAPRDWSVLATAA